MELVVEMEVALGEEVALVDVIGRRDGVWLTAILDRLRHGRSD